MERLPKVVLAGVSGGSGQTGRADGGCPSTGRRQLSIPKAAWQLGIAQLAEVGQGRVAPTNRA